MSIIHHLYGEPSQAFDAAQPLMEAITRYVNAGYTSPLLPPDSHEALLNLKVRNALSMIERAALGRMAVAEEPTLLARVHEAVDALAETQRSPEEDILTNALRELAHFLIRYLQVEGRIQ